ncbi:Hypothetical protein POVR1_LOCUS370 [uncultured virus]|nr:Hypothetical protein POVR1_LOCUS370 [uncultured virus]
MELLLNNQELTFSWHPGCGHITGKEYCVGPIGRRGPKELERQDELPPSIPSSLSFTISFIAECTGKTYDEVVKCLKDQETKDPEIAVIYCEPRKIETRVVKAEFKEVHDLFVKQNQEINDLVKQSAKLVTLLGCEVGESEYLREIPDEWFEMITTIRYSPIEVRCHKNTNFYQFMLKNGILEQVFPKWFREGNY